VQRALQKVVVWRPRVEPGRRVIPTHLKLAILGRGRIDVPPDSLTTIVEAARDRGSTWPDRLAKPLGEIIPSMLLTIELFYLNRAGMSGEEIDEAIRGYLIVRRTKQLPPGGIIEWFRSPFRHRADVAHFEKQLDLDIQKLISRSRVQISASHPSSRHLLLAYVQLPVGLGAYLRADSELELQDSKSDELAVPLPPLEARTDVHDELHLRTGPDDADRSLGVLAGDEAATSIIQKAYETDSDRIWYSLVLKTPVTVTSKPVSEGDIHYSVLNPDTGPEEIWLSAGGFSIRAIPWDAFRRGIRAWESQYLSLPLRQRITLLRRLSHKRDANFDEIFREAAGSMYLDDLRYQDGRWQMFLDYDAFIAPDGRWIEIQHVLVGLDALSRPNIRATVTGGTGVPFSLGTTWEASTWAGDLGSAVADSRTLSPGPWEWFARPKTLADRFGYFLRTRAPEYELLADVDAWGILPLLEERPDLESIDDLLALYYEDLVSPVLNVREADLLATGPALSMTPFPRRRPTAIRLFLRNYGYEFPRELRPASGAEVWRELVENVNVLASQSATRRIQGAIRTFATVWLAKNSKLAFVESLLGDPAERAEIEIATDDATRYFLFWLEQEAIRHGVDTRE
jgi:hypothetical protein